MIKDHSADHLCGLEVVDVHGERIGKVREVWADEVTGRPVWASVDSGMLGIHHSFLPLSETEQVQGQLVVGLSKHEVEDAPRVSPTGDRMSEAEDRTLFGYYNR